MAISVQDALADKGVHPSADHLQKLEAKWSELQEIKGNLDDVPINDADIALRNMPGADHVE